MREKLNEYSTVNAVATLFNGYNGNRSKHYTEHKSIGYGVFFFFKQKTAYEVE